MNCFQKIFQGGRRWFDPAACRIICLLLLLFVSFIAEQTSFGAVQEGNCDDVNELTDYGIIGEDDFQYGNNSERPKRKS